MDPYLNQAAARVHIEDLERSARERFAVAPRRRRDLLRLRLRARIRMVAVSETRS